jgi:MraZ protein
MLVGSFPMSVDSKARVTLPATFRKEMCEGDSKTIYLVPMKESVDGFTPAGFEAWIDSLFNKDGEGFDTRNRKDVLLRRSLTSRAVSVDIDSAGRVALGKLDASKPGTREKYGLTGDVTVIGADDHFEVWNTEKWNESQEAIDEELEELLFG